MFIRVHFVLNDGDILARVIKQCFEDFCDAIGNICGNRHEQWVQKIVCLQECSWPKFYEPLLTNMCARITHNNNIGKVHRDEIACFIDCVKNDFGSGLAVYTRFCNFFTSRDLKSTLIRGCSSRSDMMQAIKHVMLPESVSLLSIHNVVFTSALGHKMLEENKKVLMVLKTKMQCEASVSVSTQEHSFYVSSYIFEFSDADCDVKDFDVANVHAEFNWFLKKNPKQNNEIGCHDLRSLFESSQFNMELLSTSRVKSIRVNICKSGILNIFIALRDPGVELTELHEKILQQLANFVFVMFRLYA